MLRFLLSWLGVWPGAGLLRVAPSARRMLPDAQGLVRPLVVSSPPTARRCRCRRWPLATSAARWPLSEILAWAGCRAR
jgi:hypothetical protein